MKQYMFEMMTLIKDGKENIFVEDSALDFLYNQAFATLHQTMSYFQHGLSGENPAEAIVED